MSNRLQSIAAPPPVLITLPDGSTVEARPLSASDAVAVHEACGRPKPVARDNRGEPLPGEAERHQDEKMTFALHAEIVELAVATGETFLAPDLQRVEREIGWAGLTADGRPITGAALSAHRRLYAQAAVERLGPVLDRVWLARQVDRLAAAFTVRDAGKDSSAASGPETPAG